MGQQLYLQTMGVLWVQLLLVAMVVAYVMHQKKWKPNFLLLAIAQFVMVILILLLKNHFWPSFLVFIVLSVLNGLLIAPFFVEKSALLTVLCTMAIFLVMTLYGFMKMSTWIHHSYLFIALCALLVGVIVQWIMSFLGYQLEWLERGLSIAGIVLFSLYIAYDTRSILHSPPSTKTNPVLCALRLYYDLLNLFVFMNR
jgi:FtsH-binding integral membrane protein